MGLDFIQAHCKNSFELRIFAVANVWITGAVIGVHAKSNLMHMQPWFVTENSLQNWLWTHVGLFWNVEEGCCCWAFWCELVVYDSSCVRGETESHTFGIWLAGNTVQLFWSRRSQCTIDIAQTVGIAIPSSLSKTSATINCWSWWWWFLWVCWWWWWLLSKEHPGKENS